ncbi:transmembrane emp24 domain containing protein [Echinococcus multilocularis]|uniref:Transmembrane emp24 domain containing protein n=1 Tax=Echinococcus multilocularis TaxID=6211 RepID=A0A068Y966_ECHMU|nr:transmembrane emp24 domain containing protein [Echinococcus multilocularis]
MPVFLLIYYISLFLLSVGAQVQQQLPPDQSIQQNLHHVQVPRPPDSQNTQSDHQQNIAPLQHPSPQNVQQQQQPVPQQKLNEPDVKQVLDQPQNVQQQPGAVPVQQLNPAPPQQFNVPPGQQMPDQSNSVPLQQFNVPAQQMAQQQPPVVQQQPGTAPQQQRIDATPQQQQQSNVPPAQPVPGLKQTGVPSQQPSVQQVPQQVPVAQQHQQPSAQSPPVANHQIPPAQSPPAPSHVHNEPPPRSYESRTHDSLPPKPRQMKFEPPTILHQDSELDFYSRLPSPPKSDPDVFKNVDALRPFLSLTVNVTPAVKDCYFYEAVAGFEVDIQVLGGDGMDIGLAVFDPSGAPVILRDPSGEASVSIAVLPQYQGRAYAICLDNRKASYGRKKVYVGIDLRINWDNPSPAEQEVINQMKKRLRIGENSMEMRRVFDNFDRLTDSLDRIRGLLHRTQRLQQRSRNNAAMDRAMMEANKDRVTSWSTFQVVLLILVGVIQTRLIRSLFDEQSSLYRLWVHNGGSRSGGGSRFNTHVSGLRC